MSRKIRGVLVDTVKGTAKEALITDCLQGYYDALHCETITTVRARIRGKLYTVIADDEGALKEDRKISAFSFNRGWVVPKLVGSLFVCSERGENFAGLEEDDCTEILKNVIDLGISGYAPKALILDI